MEAISISSIIQHSLSDKLMEKEKITWHIGRIKKPGMKLWKDEMKQRGVDLLFHGKKKRKLDKIHKTINLRY